MSDLKITIDQLKNYFNTGLKIVFNYEDCEYEHDFVGLDLSYECVQLISPSGDFGRVSIDQISLKCYRLTDLDKFIPELGFVPIEELKKVDGEYYINLDDDGNIYFDDSCFIGLYEATRCYSLIQKLFQWHFWPFEQEYFEQGLVIDKIKQ